MLISPEYIALNRRLHAERDDYGRIGKRWAERAVAICRENGGSTIIDYGAGKRTLEKRIREIAPDIAVASYDPAVPEISEPPAPADLLVCTDVLEHVEPECLNEVLTDIYVLAPVHLIVVATDPSDKTLADGRNAHLIIKSPGWWGEKFTNAAFWGSDVPGPRDHECVFELRRIDIW